MMRRMERTMRPRYICLALVNVLLFPLAPAQWVQTNGTSGADGRRSPLIGGNIFAGTESRGVFLSTNNGTSWIAAKSGLSDSTVGALSISGANPRAGTAERGVFFSTDEGTTWSAANTPLENTPSQNSAASGTNFFAGNGDSVLLADAGGTAWSPAGTALPGVSFNDPFVSSPPEPSNTSDENAVVRYGLPYRSHMSLTVFNTLGRRVGLLVHRGALPGTVVKK